MEKGRESSEGVTLYLDASRSRRRLTVEVSGPRDGWQAVYGLTGWLRERPKWRGGDRIELRVDRPEAVRRAFAVSGAVTSYRQLAEEAGLAWFLPQEWRHGISHLLDWQARVMTALDEDLGAPARSPQGALFARPREAHEPSGEP